MVAEESNMYRVPFQCPVSSARASTVSPANVRSRTPGSDFGLISVKVAGDFVALLPCMPRIVPASAECHYSKAWPEAAARHKGPWPKGRSQSLTLSTPPRTHLPRK